MGCREGGAARDECTLAHVDAVDQGWASSVWVAAGWELGCAAAALYLLVAAVVRRPVVELLVRLRLLPMGTGTSMAVGP